MTQAPQSGGGRTTANVNKNTDQLDRLADKATDQARVAQHVEEFANNAAQQGREAGADPGGCRQRQGCCPTRAAVEEGIVTGGGDHAAEGRQVDNGQGFCNRSSDRNGATLRDHLWCRG
jgi:hypothetical protein